MNDIQDYDSRMNDTSMRKLETFSYLPEMDPGRIRKQVEYIVSRNLIPVIEHVEPERAGVDYWYLWKLPMFGVKDVEAILGEAETCRRANPANHVRLIGYDNLKQTQGASMVIFRG